jgi:tetratricopeptide (TPR) repeat protein
VIPLALALFAPLEDPSAAAAAWLAAAAPGDHHPPRRAAALLLAVGNPDQAMEYADRAADRAVRFLDRPAPTPDPKAKPADAPARTDPLTGAVVPTAFAADRKTEVWYPDEVLDILGRTRAAAGRWAEAIDRLGELSARRPADAGAKLAHGRALLAYGQFAEAETALTLAAALGADAAAELDHARAAMNRPVGEPVGPVGRAFRLHHAGQPDDALSAAAEALAADPRSCSLLGLTARLYLNTGRPTAAVFTVSLFDRLPLPDANRGDLLGVRAVAWLQAGCLPAAERDAETALTLTPANPDPLDTLGQIAEHRQDYPTAVGHYAALVARRPGHARARGRLALLRAAAPDPRVRDAAAALELADGLPPGPHRDALRGVALAAGGQFGPAVSAVNAALAADVGDDDRTTFLQMRERFLADRPWTGRD